MINSILMHYHTIYESILPYFGRMYQSHGATMFDIGNDAPGDPTTLSSDIDTACRISDLGYNDPLEWRLVLFRQ